jgi:hypothetical protein
MTWQPIETAPKDGTVIFAWHDMPTNKWAAFDINIKKAQWLGEQWRVEGYGGNVPANVTHWMPLPIPPSDVKDKE